MQNLDAKTLCSLGYDFATAFPPPQVRSGVGGDRIVPDRGILPFS